MSKVKDKLYKALTKNSKLFQSYLRFRGRINKSELQLLYKIEDLNKQYYNKIKNLNDTELEHNIGRLTNFKRIIPDVKNFKGDFIEFGTWRGFSLLWIAYFMEREAIFNKKLVGLDGFIGLPYADGVFPKYAFSDTSYELCKRNIMDNTVLYDITKKNISIGKFLFKQKAEIKSYIESLGISKFCFIHIDCDVTESLKEIMELLQEYDLIADKAYVLFDDYGCESDLGKTVDEIFRKMKKKWNVKEDSSTLLTKNFYLEKK